MAYKQEFAERMRIIKAKEDLTNIEFAKRVGVGPNAVSKWANGLAMPSVFTFAKLCVAMKLDARTICALLGVNAK